MFSLSISDICPGFPSAPVQGHSDPGPVQPWRPASCWGARGLLGPCHLRHLQRGPRGHLPLDGSQDRNCLPPKGLQEGVSDHPTPRSWMPRFCVPMWCLSSWMPGFNMQVYGGYLGPPCAVCVCVQPSPRALQIHVLCMCGRYWGSPWMVLNQPGARLRASPLPLN